MPVMINTTSETPTSWNTVHQLHWPKVVQQTRKNFKLFGAGRQAVSLVRVPAAKRDIRIVFK